MEKLILPCPTCGQPNDTHIVVDDTTPTPFVTVCWGCHAIAILEQYSGNLFLRLPTAEEREEIEADPIYQRAHALLSVARSPEEIMKRLHKEIELP
jgi:hypothetical protein